MIQLFKKGIAMKVWLKRKILGFVFRKKLNGFKDLWSQISNEEVELEWISNRAGLHSKIEKVLLTEEDEDKKVLLLEAMQKYGQWYFNRSNLSDVDISRLKEIHKELEKIVDGETV